MFSYSVSFLVTDNCDQIETQCLNTFKCDVMFIVSGLIAHRGSKFMFETKMKHVGSHTPGYDREIFDQIFFVWADFYG